MGLRDTWSAEMGILLPSLSIPVRRSAFAEALRQEFRPFVMPTHIRHAVLFPESGTNLARIRNTASVLDGIHATPLQLSRLTEFFGLTPSLVRDESVETKRLYAVLQDLTYIAQLDGSITRVMQRIGDGIETHLQLTTTHSRTSQLARALDAFYETREGRFYDFRTQRTSMPPRQ